MSAKHTKSQPGPFAAHQLREGDRYELTHGHPVYCAPSGRDHAGRSLTGGAVLETDPDVEWAGFDAGFSPEPGTMRAPDVAVGPPAAPGERPGWIPGVPPLAVEYASHGQDEDELQEKISELLASGTRLIWVVRLVGPRRVEIYAPDAAPRSVGPGELLSAPGILRNPVPVEALYDREAGHQATLRNLLQRLGYEDLGAVKAEGKAAGRAAGMAESILTLLHGRGLDVPAEIAERVTGCRDPAQLQTWLLAAARVACAEDILGE